MKKILFYIVCSIIIFFSFIIKCKSVTNITLDEGSLVPFFNKEIHKYNVYLHESIDEINIKAVLEESEYTEGFGNIKLKTGENEVILKVFDKNGNVKIYTLNILRGNEPVVKSDNSLLKSLKIKNYNLDFSSNVFTYNINILDENELNIEYTPYNVKSFVKMDGNSNLKSGNNKILITVTSEDETNKSVYEININKTLDVFKEEEKKEDKSSTFDKWILNDQDKLVIKVAISLVITVIIVFLYFLLFVKKGKSKKQKNP